VKPKALVSLLVPLAALAVLLVFLLRGGASFLGTAPAPIEKLYFERTVLRPEEIAVVVRNTGPEPVSIGQVLVNEAIWDFSIRPGTRLDRLEKATITMAYPWEEGQPLTIALVTSTGLRFEKEIEVARATPPADASAFLFYMLLGAYAGVVPVFLGLLWYPFLRSLGSSGVHFVLSLTVGLLVFLGVETLHEAFEVADRVPAAYQGVALILLGVAGTLIALAAAGARKPRAAQIASSADSGAWRLASLISLGIGLHNLGEGLAIGASYVLGEVALGVFLLVGFTLHNTTEGLAILAPLLRARVSIGRLALLGALAGVPTIIGAWVGGFVYSDAASLLFLAIGAGAIFQVVYQVLRFQSREAGLVPALIRPAGSLGLATGFLVMYGTGLLVSL
jgi:zinc transporter ZupT